jgi:hypothetical protein
MNRLFWFLRRLWWVLLGVSFVRVYVIRYADQVVEPAVPVPGLEVPFNVYRERFQATLRLNPHQQPPVARECWIDTGAYLTVIPEKTWRLVEQQVIWLQSPDGQNLPGWLTTARIAGGPFPCRPGLLQIQVTDDDNRSLPPGYVVALVVEDGGRMTMPILLGLEGRVFTGRRLELLYDEMGGWLIQR